MLYDEQRCQKLVTKNGPIALDFTHMKIDSKGLELLAAVAEELKLKDKLKAMFNGEKINSTEGRSVLHVALRRPKTPALMINDKNILEDVHQVLDQIKNFSTRVREGKFVGATGKKLTNIVAIGIGGSFLGPEFVYEALKHDKTSQASAKGMKLRFLANVDPIDFYRAIEGLDIS